MNNENWVPAHGGTEKPYETRNGHLVQYMFCPATKVHQYLDVRNDIFIDNDSDALREYGILDPLPCAEEALHRTLINLTVAQAKEWLNTIDQYKLMWINFNILDVCGHGRTDSNIEKIEKQFKNLLSA